MAGAPTGGAGACSNQCGRSSGRCWRGTSGAAALPHVLAALTVLIPLTLFGVVLKSPWPAVGALALLLVIDVTLRLG